MALESGASLSFERSGFFFYDGPKEWNEQELTSFAKGDIFELIFQKMPSQSAGEHAQRNVLAMLKRVFQMAIDEGLLLKNPTQGITARVSPPEQKVLTPEEVQKLLSAAKETQHRFYHVWAFALFSGMRSGEMYALTWSDIDLSADLISVTKQWTNGEQAQVLKEYCRALEITDVKFHDLRATFITNMLSQGVPLVTVMSIVGHRKMSTTDVYVRLAGVNIKGATEKLSYALPDASPANVIKMAFTE
jgi:integrase